MRSFRQLIETVTTDFAVNEIIEQRLKGLNSDDRAIALDVIELIYNAGANGIAITSVQSKLRQMWPDQDAHIVDIIRVVREHLGEYIQDVGGLGGTLLVFHAPTAQADAPVDDLSHEGRMAADQIRLVGRILEVCKQLGRFTAHDVLNAIAAVTAYAPAMLRAVVDHVLESNSGVIKPEGQGYYRFAEPVAKSSMGFWRDLEGYQPPKD